MRRQREGKRKSGEARRQATDFKETACYPSAVVQRAARPKIVCAREVPGATGIFRKANSHF